MHFAHSTGDASRQDWQPLPDHLDAVGRLAALMASVFGMENVARIAGLLHDIGKCTPDFDRRLEGGPAVEHSLAGAFLIRQRGGAPLERLMGELTAYAIAGHHAGLPDWRGDGSSLSARLEDFNPDVLDVAWKGYLPVDLGSLAPSRRLKATKEDMGFALAFLGRMLFSCLADADFQDTERFYAKVEGHVVDRRWPRLASLLPDLVTRFDVYMAGKARKAGNTPVNRLRAEVLAGVRARAADPQGLFTLTVPTGGGKTLTSLAFALEHARAHKLDRIVYAIPFTSVIDQTADVFRDVLGEDVVLEHHSSLDEEKLKHRADRDKLKLARENWDAPIIVTTSVQLFESLFSDRPSRCRKLHNLSRAVIVLDEAQTLPRPFLVPIMRAIGELAANYATSVVLCTATQPALGAEHFGPRGLPLAGRELAPDPEGLARRLSRNRLVLAGEMDNDALVAALAGRQQALVVVNGRAHALDLHQQAKDAGLDGILHLTTRQHAVHRRRILAEVRRRLETGLPCRLIATSLIEAGVDVDFPCALRAEAGLDQIAQIAGRVNRSGNRDPETSLVTVFKPVGYPVPREIEGLVKDFKRMKDAYGELFSPAAMTAYFREVYWRMDEKLDQERIVEKFRADDKLLTTDFAYRTVGERFRMIESGLLPVIVATEEAAKGAVATLGIKDIPSGAIARALQGYIVQVPPRARAKLLAAGHVRLEQQALRGDQFAVLRADSLYREDVGLLWEEPDYLADENTFI
jgi:CRISPR-associated endonuclease/helicase Cas3